MHFVLSTAALATFSQPTRDEIVGYLLREVENADPEAVPLEQSGQAPKPSAASGPFSPAAFGGIGPNVLSRTQLKRVWSGLSQQTQSVMRKIAESPSDTFKLEDVAKAVGITMREQAGSLGGITKRTRRILNDDTAVLVAYSQDANGVWYGQVNPTTRGNLRVLVGMS